MTRSSERLLASSMAYFATFDRSPANFRSGVSEEANVLSRSESRTRRVEKVGIRFVRISISIEDGVSR